VSFRLKSARVLGKRWLNIFKILLLGSLSVDNIGLKSKGCETQSFSGLLLRSMEWEFREQITRLYQPYLKGYCHKSQ